MSLASTGLSARSRALFAVMLAGMAVAGCGIATRTVTERASRPAGTVRTQTVATAQGARDTMRRFLLALRDGRGRDACALMTRDGQAQVGGGDPAGCASRIVLARQTVTAGQLDAAIARERTAPVTVHGNRAQTSSLNGATTMLVFTGGRWLIGPG